MSYAFGGLTLANVGDIVTQTSVSVNFEKLVENSASATAPASPRTGQLWYDTSAGAGLGVMKTNIGTPAAPNFIELSGGGGGGLTYVFKTASYTASAGEGVLTDTSAGAFTVTLPATPTLGDQVVVADAGNAWGTNNLTVGRNGSTIGGLAQDLVCDITGASVQLVYDGTTWETYAQIGGTGGNALPFSNNTSLAQVQAVALYF
jgi:hypothetical protein